MNINQELVEKVKAGTHCIEYDGNLELLEVLLKETVPDDTYTPDGSGKLYYIADGQWWGRSSEINRINIPLSSFFLPTPKMIPVEELERLIINRDVWLESFDDHKKGMNALFDKLQEKINKYK